MIKWLTTDIGTGAYEQVITSLPQEVVLLDVRDLVDKEGNNKDIIKQKIEDGLAVLKRGKKLVVCCDYGMSRSNAVAIGLMTYHYNMSFSDAFNKARQQVSERDIKLSVLNAIYEIIETDRQKSENRYSNKATKKILVTGGSGFIGKKLIPILQRQYEVFAPSSSQINVAEQSISLNLLVKENKIDTLIHLANPRVYTSVESMGKSLIMLKNILEVCVQNNIKLIYPSGWEIYSAYNTSLLYADESLPAYPKGTYGESKWLAEHLIEHYRKAHSLKYIILRSSPLYGPGSDKPKFIYNFIEKALKNEPIVTHEYTNGKPSLDLLHVNDFVVALQSIIAMDDNLQQTLNIGTGLVTSTFEIAKMIVALLGSSSTVSSIRVQESYACIAMNTKKIKNLLSWESKISIEEGIKELLKNYYRI